MSCALRSKKNAKRGGKSQITGAEMSVDPAPVLRLSSAEKFRLKNQLTEECFSVPMEDDIPTYRWYVNILPKEEEIDEMDFSQMHSTQNYLDMSFFTEPKMEPLDEFILRDEMEFKEEPLEEPLNDFVDINQMLGVDGQFSTESFMGGEERETMDTETNDLAQENEALKSKMAEMRKEQHDRTNRANAWKAQENEALKRGMAEIRKEHNDRMANLITRASDCQLRDRARIEELENKLAQHDGRLQTQRQLHQPQQFPCLATGEVALHAENAEKLLDAEKKKVEELRENVRKLEEMLQRKVIELEERAWRDRKETELRAQFESHRRSGQDKVEELERNLVELSSKLDQEIRFAANTFAVNRELERENNTLNTERTEQIERMANATILMETERQQARDDLARDRGRIEELELKAAQYEAKVEQLQDVIHAQPPVQQQQPPLLLEEAWLNTKRAELRAEFAEIRVRTGEEKVKELEKNLAEISSKLDEERRWAAIANTELEDENKALKTYRAVLLERITNANILMETERQQARDDQARDRGRIDELTLNLAQCEAKLQQLLLLQAATVPALSDEVVTFGDISYPLANAALSEKLLDLVQQAVTYEQLANGVKQVKKALNRGAAEIVLLAADIEPYCPSLDLPVLCAMKGVPFVFVQSKVALSRAGAVHGCVTACSIIRTEGSHRYQLDHQIREIQKEIVKRL